MESLELIEYEEFKNQFVLKAMVKHVCVSHAVYHVFEGTLYLTWIETQAEFRGKGYAFKLLDYLAEKALVQKINIAIIVIDEYTINDFYFNWYVKRIGADDEAVDEVKQKFNTLLSQGDTPSLLFSPKDLIWQLSG